MKGYLLCLLNLKKLIDPVYVEMALNEIIENIKNITFQLIAKDKLKFSRSLIKIIFDFNLSDNFTDKLQNDIIISIKKFKSLIILERKTLRVYQDNFDKWKNLVLESIYLCLNLEQNIKNNTVSLFCDYIESCINSNIEEKDINAQMVNFIDQLRNKFVHPLINEIIEDIDNFIIYPCYFLDIEFPELQQIFERLYLKYKNVLKELNKIYYNTKRGQIPDFQASLSHFLKRFLKKGCTLDTKDYLKKLSKKGIPVLSLSNTIKLLLKYPDNIKYILAEAFAGFNLDPISYCKFIFESVKKGIKYRLIEEEWARDFIDIVCNPPFVKKYSKIINGNDLRLIITEKNYKIVIMDLPDYILWNEY